ncbi:hypothetical protein CHLRE_02g095064v5 [Chlamydomonas reinhardtii]|uniref:Uncharacterized protein n=1 Tax=Chlamydomonas reinhardtii TaxID=3055 RepID=A0A2K3E1P9_CHLRE|nr:uncharacterized protein CHLRE_02g095064v5 [Chlamydomonas reinhardtii]PNW86677.1 hypothetical protein CHLRE_02g095064v5 [Chlamydomonas reinhardtii]
MHRGFTHSLIPIGADAREERFHFLAHQTWAGHRAAYKRYWFSGKHLYIKMADPGAGDYRLMGRDPYSACPWVSGTPSAPNPSTGTSYPPNPLSPGARFCPLAADPATDAPESPPAAYNSWMDPFCTDVAPPGEDRDELRSCVLGCSQVAAQGQCGSGAIRAPADPHAAVIGGYCAVSCGVCVQGAPSTAPPAMGHGA